MEPTRVTRRRVAVNVPLQENVQLSDYELERLENIRKNQAFLSSIHLSQAKEELRQLVRLKTANRGVKTRVTPRAVRDVPPPRKSLRLQGKSVLPTDNTADQQQLPAPDAIQETRRKTPGPLPMDAINTEEGSPLPPALLELCSEKLAEEKVNLGLKEYRSALEGMALQEGGVAKVVHKRITSVALHAGVSHILAAAGDNMGHVGLWNLGASWGDDGVLVFKPHTRAVGCMAFSPADPAHLLSLSADGSIRCMDAEKAVFLDVYDIEEGLKTFDFLSEDCSTLVVGAWHGDVAVVDRRTPGTGHVSLFSLGPENPVRCVSVHPRHKQYFVAAQGREVKIYDHRCLKGKAVTELSGHTLGTNGARFSPGTGNRVLTTCNDHQLRIYNTSEMTKVCPLLNSIRHNMDTGRWLSRLSAEWDPKQEECFVVGSLERPRRVQVFHQGGQLLHSFRSPQHLSTVLSLTTFHPARNTLLGGNSSGYLHVFTD